MNIRKAEMRDLIALQQCSICVLAENYPMVLWSLILREWSELAYLAEDDSGKIVGCCICTIDPVPGNEYVMYGSVTSLFVSRPYRRLGLAKGLMDAVRDAIFTIYEDVLFIELTVRETNRVARTLYEDVLGYTKQCKVPNYYEDEDAWQMRLLRPGETEESVDKHLRRYKRAWERDEKERMEEDENDIETLDNLLAESDQEAKKKQSKRSNVLAAIREVWATKMRRLAARKVRRTTSMP
ncbi:acyl-CoA N-acyltransferase [Phlebopus sp. FC_14]|nr:acyl-CoA N-acyltransferase [Phlebopus sp. FC_14]